jgi:hypothetical protein
MFGNTAFGYNTVQIVTETFGSLFKDLTVNRYNANNVPYQSLKVPVLYGPRDKALARTIADPNLNKKIAIDLPIISYEFTGNLSYDAERKLNDNSMIASVSSNNPNGMNYQFTPVPYDYSFNVYVITRTLEDANQIVEQILPFFTPAYAYTVQLLGGLGYPQSPMKISAVLNHSSLSDDYEGDLITRRSIIWTFNFTVKAYLFGPNRFSPVIKQITVNYTINANTTFNAGAPSLSGNVTPGLDANGNPTSNVSVSVPWQTIEANSNFGIVTQFTQNSA